MPEIAIRLDPAALANPDADLRYLLPEAISAISGGQLEEDGYDYDEAGRMLIFLHAKSLEQSLPLVLGALEQIEILGNRFMTATVAVSEDSHCVDLSRFEIVHPPGLAGPLERGG